MTRPPRETETSRNCSGCLGLRKRSARSKGTEAQRPNTPALKIPWSRPFKRDAHRLHGQTSLRQQATNNACCPSGITWAYWVCTYGGPLMPGRGIHDGLADDGYLFLDQGEIFWGSDWIPPGRHLRFAEHNIGGPPGCQSEPLLCKLTVAPASCRQTAGTATLRFACFRVS